MTSTEKPLGIIAGRGSLPLQLAEHCREQGRACLVVGLEGETEMAPYAAFPNATVKLGHIGKMMQLLAEFGAQEVVMAGPIHRPKLRNIRTDAAGAKLLARLLKAKLLGDDALLSIVIRWIEEHGIRVVGADAVMQQLLAPAGPLGRHVPDAEAEADIALGIRVLTTLGPLDIGQSVIVQRGYVLGIEAAEGTEALIARCATYPTGNQGGVLVKLPKAGQDTRADLPTIGPETLEQIAAAGFQGIAIQAGGALMLRQDAMRRKADASGLFVVGIEPAIAEHA